MLLAAVLAGAGAAHALNLEAPATLPLAPTRAEWSEILEAARRGSDDNAPLTVDDCPDAAFASTAERDAAQTAEGGDPLRAYARLCRQAATEARLRTQRLNRSRCCGG